MMRLVLRRLVAGIVTIWCIYTITFVMVVSLPGNPFQQGQHRLSPDVEAALRARYHMDNNWLYYLEFLEGAVHLDFGPTFMYPDWTCNQIIASSLPVSMAIGLLAMLIATVAGVPIGVIGAVRRHGFVDVSTTTLIFAGISLPTFVTGSALLVVVAVHWRLAPVGGWGSFAHLPLPAITLALPFAAAIARLMRTSMLDTLGSDFVRTALAKGAGRSRAIWRHAVPVAVLPVLSFLGPATAQAMTGSFVVEKVFGVPGIGQHFVNAALNRDPGLLLGTVLVFSTMLVLFNMAVDLLYRAVDPRIREGV